ncbi:MAG: PspA/IM30 family protein [Promicromonosporaceae bacterium]|nr:PspA/IM30 family protein [Promicromonosporaceae bacterium]
MAQKQSILGRIAQLTRANINALLDRAEDPQKMLDQLVRDYTNNIAEAEQAIAQTIGNLRLAEQDYNEDVASVQEWGNKALAASRKADAMRTAGNFADADKFDNLARIALQKQMDAESQVRSAQPMIESQRQTVEQLKTGLVQMREKLGQLRSRRDSLVARQKSAQAQQTVQSAISSINVLDPTSELSRFEEVVRREEAKAIGQTEIAALSLDSQFAELTRSSNDIELSTRLAALKAGDAPIAQIAPTVITPTEADWALLAE